MKFLRSMLSLLLLSTLSLTANAGSSRHKSDKTKPKEIKPETLPVTTSSAAAARYFENGMVHYENHRWNLALNEWQEAIKLDPHFALAYTWICMTTTDPAEESANRALAKASMKDASPGEQLVVRWMAGIHENNYVEGIAAMNDVLALYPRDKRLNFLVGYWLY